MKTIKIMKIKMVRMNKVLLLQLLSKIQKLKKKQTMVKIKLLMQHLIKKIMIKKNRKKKLLIKMMGNLNRNIKYLQNVFKELKREIYLSNVKVLKLLFINLKKLVKRAIKKPMKSKVVIKHQEDYFCGLRRLSNLMKKFMKNTKVSIYLLVSHKMSIILNITYMECIREKDVMFLF